MIVTRQRSKRRSIVPILLPFVAIAAVVVALMWPPSRNAIANGPLRPGVAAAGQALAVAARPLTFAGQQQTITDRNRTIRTLEGQLDDARKAKAADDARITQLQQQVTALANQPRPKPAPPRPAPAARAAAGSVAAGNAVAGSASTAAAPTDDQKRIAATWGAMDPDKAAALIQRLPDDQVVPILAAMDPDSAAAILNALPAKVGARLSRASAQVSAAPGR